MSPPRDVKTQPLVPVNVSLSGHRVFADDHGKTRSSGWARIPCDCPNENPGHGGRHADREDDEKTQGECHPQAKERPRPPKAGPEAWNTACPRALGRSQPARTLIPSLSRPAGKQHISAIVTHPTHGALLGQPQQTSALGLGQESAHFFLKGPDIHILGPGALRFLLQLLDQAVVT